MNEIQSIRSTMTSITKVDRESKSLSYEIRQRSADDSSFFVRQVSYTLPFGSTLDLEQIEQKDYLMTSIMMNGNWYVVSLVASNGSIVDASLYDAAAERFEEFLRNSR